VQALVENPDRRYIYVEMAFFWRWWNEQSDEIRNTVKQLVNEGSYNLFRLILYLNR
jgi:lysosomal alpha-mannosidase